MPYFLSDRLINSGEAFSIEGEEARHILLSRRIKSGEKLAVQDTNKKRFLCELIDVRKNAIDMLPLEEIKAPKEPELKIYLFQSLIKEQPLDYVIQKSTELGASGICLFNSKRSLERFKKLENKLGRWNKISLEAAKQSDRLFPLEISYVQSEKLLLEKISGLDQIFLLDPSAKTTFSEWREKLSMNTVGILIGPEGGFDEQEVKNFSRLPNIAKINMGPRILRADTAPIAALSIIQSLWGDLR